jgi:hypothetical protein
MRLIASVCAMVAISATAFATSVVPADLGTLARDARAIARGRVVAVEGQWTDGRRTIETIVTLETETYLKGQLGDTLQFRIPGGTLGRYHNIVVGAPRFAVGQRVVVFLGARGPMIPFVLGLHQGVFRIARDEGGQDTVNPPPLPQGATGRIIRGQVLRNAKPLAAFEREVRELAEGVR